MSKEKLSKIDYILKAAKLYGLGKTEIKALEDLLSGKWEDDFIRRRTDYLFRLYDQYNSDENPDRIRMNEDGIVNLNDYSFEISKRRLQKSSDIGRFWILSSNLESYLVTSEGTDNTDIVGKYRGISEKNNFLLPQVAKQLGVQATVYYKGEYTDDYGEFSRYHLTKNFLNGDDFLIRGDSIIKDNPKKKRVKFETLLKQTDEYIKRNHKRKKLPQEELKDTRAEIRQGLIKQTFFNKFVFNENESNKKWGLIRSIDGRLRLAPLFSYDYSCGAKPNEKTYHRCVDDNKEDIQSFMFRYGDEEWFRKWISKKVLKFNLDDAISEMTDITKISLTEEEKEYYNFLFTGMKEKIQEVVDLDYDEEEFARRKALKTRLKTRIVGVARRFKPKKTIPDGQDDDGEFSEFSDEERVKNEGSVEKENEQGVEPFDD